MSKQTVVRWTCDWCGNVTETLPVIKTHETLPPKTLPAKMQTNWITISASEGNALPFKSVEQICDKCADAVHEAKLARTQAT